MCREQSVHPVWSQKNPPAPSSVQIPMRAGQRSPHAAQFVAVPSSVHTPAHST
jgi:hypothetical protein